MARDRDMEMEGAMKALDVAQRAQEAAESLLPLFQAAMSVGFVLAAYYFTQADRNRPNSVTKDDNQVGIKLTLYAIAMVGVGLVVKGANGFLAYALGGFKGGSGPLKEAMPSLLVGGGVAAAVLFALLPKTNAATQKQPMRYFLGALAIVHAGAAVVALNGVLTGLFSDKGWAMYTSKQLANLVANGGVGFFALLQFGKISGWTMAPPASQYPPAAGGGYPPPPAQGGGYPPAQGGGGYPQQGGGYPPQGGGYGGGGSGGYPPPA